LQGSQGGKEKEKWDDYGALLKKIEEPEILDEREKKRTAFAVHAHYEGEGIFACPVVTTSTGREGPGGSFTVIPGTRP